jgi:hypothetical protein
MATVEIRVGDIGTVIEVTVSDGTGPLDLTGHTRADLIFVKPDQTKVTKTGVVPLPETDGKITWTTTLATDFDQAGTWQIQADVEIPGGSWKSTIGCFEVFPNL